MNHISNVVYKKLFSGATLLLVLISKSSKPSVRKYWRNESSLTARKWQCSYIKNILMQLLPQSILTFYFDRYSLTETPSENHWYGISGSSGEVSHMLQLHGTLAMSQEGVVVRKLDLDLEEWRSKPRSAMRLPGWPWATHYLSPPAQIVVTTKG